jgi:hypothetical protein
MKAPGYLFQRGRTVTLLGARTRSRNFEKNRAASEVR